MAQLEPLNLRITGNANGLSAELGKAQRDVSSFSGGLSGQVAGLKNVFAGIGTPIVAGVTAAFAALAAGAATAVVAISGVYDELDRIADKADVADKLAISFTELRGLEFSLGELTGLDTGTIDNALQRLLVGLNEAREGSGKTKEVLDRLGLDAGRLLQLGPVEALKQIAEATRRLGDPTAQLAVAYDLFGKNAAQLVGALRGGADAIEDSYNFAAQWLGLSDAQVAGAAAASDSWARVLVIFEGLVQLGAAELAPLFTVFTESFLASVNEIGGMQEAMRAFVDTLATAVGLAKDLYELFTVQFDVLGRIAVGDFYGALNDATEALTFDSAEKILERLNQVRAETDRQVAEQRAERDKLREQQANGPRIDPDTRFPVTDPNGDQGGGTDAAGRAAALAEAQRLQLEQAREAERQSQQRHQEQMDKLDKARESTDKLLDAIQNQDEPIPVDL
jgi:hypothetical protein